MPGRSRGRPPKRELQREDRTAARAAEMTNLSDDGALRGPELPEHEWHTRTLAWWDTWRRSPLAQTFTPVDWDYLADTALLHTQLSNGQHSAAAELRLRICKFGASPEDRLRLKVDITDEVAAAKAEPRVNAERKARLVAVANA